ncbi:MAG: discoidin domain-containing protein [Prevotellaceae bacterium]|nr:discoidin domain-containing protein [Prevotellaceae bacterium]
MFDLQESTFWHTAYSSATSSKHTHPIVIDPDKEYTVSGFSYLSHPESNQSDMIKDYTIYVKNVYYIYTFCIFVTGSMI